MGMGEPGNIGHAPVSAVDASVPLLVDHLFRHEAGQVIATLTRLLGPRHLELAEDVVQETLIKALRHWSYHGVPENPAGWIMRVARNNALDLIRRETALRERGAELARALTERATQAETTPEVLDSLLRDDQLRMIFACCHPALAREAQVALTLKLLCGFEVPEIARAFLAPEPTIAQRLVRAKRTLRASGSALDVPDAAHLSARLDAVLAVLYLLFNEGYSASSGEELIRHEVCLEAIRLTWLVAEHPACDLPRVHALLSLMLLAAARFPARTDAAGELLQLEHQDRARWDRRLIALGMSELERSACGDELSPYHVQAGIAACHALAPSFEATDWGRILADYDALLAIAPSPVVALNRVVALAMVDGPDAGLRAWERLADAPGMARYHLAHATAGWLWERLGNRERARQCYTRARELAPTEPERRFLARRIAACE
jgi:RNA polymerase sigma-70 factor (ECF subfamily)